MNIVIKQVSRDSNMGICANSLCYGINLHGYQSFANPFFLEYQILPTHVQLHPACTSEIVHGNFWNRFLVPEQSSKALAKKFEALLSDTVMTERFRQVGYVTMSNCFSWDGISRQFFEAYEPLLDKYSENGVGHEDRF